LLMYAEGAVPAGAQKAYYSIPTQNIKADKQIDISRVKVERTGEMKTIMGVPCEKIIGRTNKTITEMWVTTVFKTDYYLFYPFFQNSFELLVLNEEKIQGFPLSSVTKDLTGKLIISTEVVSASITNLSASDFMVPAEYINSEDLSKVKK
jgi:hypothetical protein